MLRIEWAEEYALYFGWLLDLVGGEEWWGGKERQLSRLLHRKFYWNNEIDANMAAHALELRTAALEQTDIPAYMIPGGEASVLEVLVSLSYRIDNSIMFNPEYGSRATQFFSELISILGFDELDVDQIDSRIDDFLDGNVKIMDGEFGMDPNNPSLWEQVNAYYSPLFDLENDDGY